MSELISITVPDIGDFEGVEVIEIYVKPGDHIDLEAPLIALESDKASMDIPATQTGVVQNILVKLGDRVSRGSPILTLQSTTATPQATPDEPSETKTAEKPHTAAPKEQIKADLHAEVLVLGAGPGGYTAAFRAADLGKKVVLVERYPNLGGVCLNVGCIPSKALLHAAKVITEAEEMCEHGIRFDKPKIDLEQLRNWKNQSVVSKLTVGLSQLAKQRKISVVQGTAAFASEHQIKVTHKDQTTQVISFDYAIIAAGSHARKASSFGDDPRIIDSTGALQLQDIPKRLLVIGGGIIGLEMGTVYDALGSRVSIVELTDGLIPEADRDLVKPLQKRMEKRFENILLKTKVSKIEPQKSGLQVSFESDSPIPPQMYDRVLVATGRVPNGKTIAVEQAGVFVNEQGFITVDAQMRTNIPHIFAIGDIVGQPMLAHKAVHEGKIAAEVIAGHKVAFQAMAIPAVAYTDPEVAWAGVTEKQAVEQNLNIEKAVFPWAASGRALSIGRTEGMTKLILDAETRRVIGAGIVGQNAGELLAETVLAIEMGADTEDIGLTIHAHPTLSETICFAAEMAEGTITDLLPPRKRG